MRHDRLGGFMGNLSTRWKISRLILVSSAVGAVVSIVATAYLNKSFSLKILWWGGLYGVYVGNVIGFAEYFIGDPIERRLQSLPKPLFFVTRIALYFVIAIGAYLLSLFVVNPFPEHPLKSGGYITWILAVCGGVSVVTGILFGAYESLKSQLADYYEKAKDQEIMARELQVAHDFQAALLPRTQPQIPGHEVFTHFRAAKEVGGDYYDFLSLPNGVGIVIADVSGKGVPAALLMANLQATFRGLAEECRPEELVSRVNKKIFENTLPGVFTTLFFGLLDPSSGRLHYVNAGHCPALVVRANGNPEWLQEGGLVLGVLHDSGFSAGSLVLRDGDVLSLFTDGVTEAGLPRREPWGDNNLCKTIMGCRELSASEIGLRVLEEVDRYVSQETATDDMALIILKKSDLEA
jgi:serine phosphatase RsbU (regulator of sigma subunit)